MSNWTTINGTVTIPKKHKVSIREVFDTATGAEMFLDLSTQSSGHMNHHHIKCMVKLEGLEFMKVWPEIFKRLPHVKGTLDLTFGIRVID